MAHASGASTSASTAPPPCPWLSSGHCRANNGSFGMCRRDGSCPDAAAPAARTIPASPVAPNVRRARLAQNVVPTVTRPVFDAADEHFVGAERYVALVRERVAGQVVHGLAREEVEFLRVRAIGHLDGEPADRHEAPRVLALAAWHDLLDEHRILDGCVVAAVPRGRVGIHRQVANAQPAESVRRELDLVAHREVRVVVAVSDDADAEHDGAVAHRGRASWVDYRAYGAARRD